MDDDALLLHELQRLETERKLRAIPGDILTTAWVREAQIEAVIDAMLAVKYAGNVSGYASARHVGEWCARIAGALADLAGPAAARRFGVLSEFDDSVLSGVAELRYLVPSRWRFARIVAIARDFDRLVAKMTPRLAIVELRKTADADALRVVDALSEMLNANRARAPKQPSLSSDQKRLHRFHAFA